MKISKLFKITAITAALLVLSICILGVGAASSEDPSDTYNKRTAQYEDSSLSLWFDHSFRKNFTSDTTSTSRDTYSVYMAKNEIESAQFVLYSDTDKTDMSASVTDFTDGKGNTVSAELFYEMYITTENLDLNGVYGMSASDTFIREGETPDPIVPLSGLGTTAKAGLFQLNGGKSQAFLIRAKTDSNTVSGWYSAELNIYNSAKQQVKVATVYLYVWDFEISDSTTFRTAMYTGNNLTYGGSYTEFYDYLLENRMNAMDMPSGKPTSTNPYLNNPRVNSVRVSSNGLGSVSTSAYMERTPSDFATYKSIYEDMSSSPNWETYKKKLYIYTNDEITCKLHGDYETIDDVTKNAKALKEIWPDAKTLVTFHQNVPWPDKYTRDLSTYEDYEKKDGMEHLFETDSVKIFVPQLYYFTPDKVFADAGMSARGNYTSTNYPLYSINGVISGIYKAEGASAATWTYYNWSELYGQFSDRLRSYKEVKGDDVEIWTYRAGSNHMYTYCNHLIENTGLQTKMLFWQCYQEDITGYLFYDTNGWNERTNSNGAYETDTTVTGSKKTCKWFTNKYTYAGTGYNIYGMGVLFYTNSMSRTRGDSVIGTVRVECMRDGIEEYEMLCMLEKLKGEERAKEVVGMVSNNVTDYLSMNSFDTSSWGNADEYDIMAAVRKLLGNEIEAALASGECDHTYNSGVTTKAASCLEMGEITYTCTKCQAVKTENIPAKHTVGDCFTLESETPATCTEDGARIMKCTLCGYRKTVEITAYHNDSSKYIYTSKNETQHTVKCSECGQMLNSAQQHNIFTVSSAATCTEGGTSETKCIHCGYVSSSSATDALGHDFADGVCTRCGEKESPTYTPGDVDSSGKINASDVNILKRVILGLEAGNEACDVNSDTKINTSDVVELMKIILG